MDEIIVRQVLRKDLDECFTVETSGFPPEAAAPRETIELHKESYRRS